MSSSIKKIQQAYKHCMAIAQNHYENFPIASQLLNRHLRYPISAVYAFARSADDFADEGNFTRSERLIFLNEYIAELEKIECELKNHSPQNENIFIHASNNSIFIALADVIHKFQIPVSLFYDLISAFKQDVNTTRYQSFNDIINYSQLSANPVGQILLYLNKSASPENLNYSDAICTGLQLINFYQDINQDMVENDRLYLPLDEMAHYGVLINDLKKQLNNNQTQALMSFQLQRARKIYESGKPLCANLTGRFAIEIRMIYAGGKLIFDKLEGNVASIYLRPRLSRTDRLKILWQGFFSSY